MEIRKMDALLLKMLILCAAGIVVTQVLNRDSLTSALFLATFPLTVLLWLRSVRKTMTGMDLLVLLTAALATVSVLLDITFEPYNIDTVINIDSAKVVDSTDMSVVVEVDCTIHGEAKKRKITLCKENEVWLLDSPTY
jgi:hypothetical protein